MRVAGHRCLSAFRYFNFLKSDRSGKRGTTGENLEWLNNISSFKVSSGIVLQASSGDADYVLMLKRYDGALTLPKGGFETDETLRSAAIREFEQETGVSASPSWVPEPLGWYPNFISEPDGRTQIKYIFYFRVRITVDALPQPNPGAEHKGAIWIDLRDAQTHRFSYRHICNVIQQLENEL